MNIEQKTGQYKNQKLNKNVTVCSITLTPGLWLIIGYIDGNISSDFIYNNTLFDQTVRESMIGGGGSINVILRGIDTTTTGNLTMHSNSITTDYSVRPILYRANSFEAMVYIDGLKNLTKGKTITIATLPEIARPTGNRIVDATSPSGAYVRISVTASGLIEAYLYTDITPENVIITFTYIK